MTEPKVGSPEREAAELAKLHAETAEIEARTIRAAVLAAQADERTALRAKALGLAVETAELEVQRGRHDVELEEIGLRGAHRDEDLILRQFEYQHTYNFVGSVHSSVVQPCIETLNSWSVRDPGCDITIVFNSPGGAVFDGMALFDFIRWLSRKGHKITTISLGYAASMAGILLQAGDHRVMAKGSWLLIHEVSSEAYGKIGEIEDSFRLGERLKKQGQPLRGDVTTHRFQKLLVRHDLPRVRFHDLRRLAATVLLASGATLHEVRATLGHSSIKLTSETYGYLLPETSRESAAEVERILGGARSGNDRPSAGSSRDHRTEGNVVQVSTKRPA